ncbi:hypothetical protein SELMODRAFT_430650 [Selaginella moellendorffii]|uniref:Uncharacterized protein n=1 Tax=Selaginella moellendorffii TaxID=88036 RepID=D8TA25_SELML|nr:hypothetical protein SELMODRAFT_430650 [Selaginella moellendorffii]
MFDATFHGLAAKSKKKKKMVLHPLVASSASSSDSQGATPKTMEEKNSREVENQSRMTTSSSIRVLSSGSSDNELLKVLLLILIRLRQQAADHSRPALGTLLDEITTAEVPFVLALAMSADWHQLASIAIMIAYKSTPDLTVVVNLCPYTVYGCSEKIIAMIWIRRSGD